MNVQADLGLCYPHMPKDMFSHCAAHMQVMSTLHPDDNADTTEEQTE